MAEKTIFQLTREADDRDLMAIYGIRTRADVYRAATKFDGSPQDVTSPAGRFADTIFCAACRHFGATVCSGCGQLTIDNEINSYGDTRMGAHANQCAYRLCNKCDEDITEAVSVLPQWVKDRDLPALLPVLVNAYVATKAEPR